MSKAITQDQVREATLGLFEYCRVRDWAGYDPYDALNSRLLDWLPFLNSRWPRIALTQALKRSPINLRKLLFIPGTQNPKGLGLFLRSMIKLDRAGLLRNKEELDSIAKLIQTLRTPGTEYWCWGYSFPWQTRTIVVPRGAASLVCTTFVAESLLDLYEHTGKAEYLEMAVSAAEYIINELYWSEGTSVASLSYPLASSRSQIHNANFLGAALLCRVRRLTGEDKFLAPAMKVARYSASRQRADGSWLYGELPTQDWVDNFHTGYNLCALRAICRDASTNEFESHIRKGFKFYKGHFFRKDGAARYFHNKTYPIDAHCVAQGIITLLEFRELDKDCSRLGQSVVEWAMRNLRDKEGFFYYRVLPFATIKTSYMRWVQAWMLLALATYLENAGEQAPAVGNSIVEEEVTV